MRLPGSEAWAEADVEAALAFAENLRIAALAIGVQVAEAAPPGGPVVTSPWHPTDVVHEIGTAAAIAFATGRTREGLRIAGSLLSFPGSPPRQTLMQVVFGATLGVLAGTAEVTVVGEEVEVAFAGRRGSASFDLSIHGSVQRRRLADLVVPAAFASRDFLQEVRGRRADGFAFRRAFDPLLSPDTQSPFVRLARGWRDDGRIDQSLLTGRLLEFEAYVGALRAEEASWAAMEVRGPLIDWPLLAMLVGVHRAVDTHPEEDLAPGPASRFLQDLARVLAGEPGRADG